MSRRTLPTNKLENPADCYAIVLTKVEWSEFQTALDAPPRPLPRMQRLLTEPGFFDADSCSTRTSR
jgi:uncharacterized protein (DUF1778 family)